MDKTYFLNTLQFMPQFDNFNYYNNEMMSISQEKEFSFINNEIIPLQGSFKIPKVKFVTIKKRNKTPFFISKKTIIEKIKIKSLISNGRWTKEERIKFAYGLYKFGTNWRKIKEYILTRNLSQLRSHAQKYLIKLKSSPFLIKKGLNLANLNWEKTLNLIRKELNDEETLSILVSIESELEDNKRMTNRYIERKELMLRKKLFASYKHNSYISNSDENNTNNTENIYKETEVGHFNDGKHFNNLININDDNDSIIFNPQKMECRHYIKYEKQNIFLDKYINNFSNFSFCKENNFNYFEKEEKSEINDF